MTVSGALCVLASGTVETLKWPADSWGSHQMGPKPFMSLLIALDHTGWTMSAALGQSPDSLTVVAVSTVVGQLSLPRITGRQCASTTV